MLFRSNIAYILVQSTIGHEMEVLSDLLKIDLVKEAKGTFGYYDILVKIEASSENEIWSKSDTILVSVSKFSKPISYESISICFQL